MTKKEMAFLKFFYLQYFMREFFVEEIPTERMPDCVTRKNQFNLITRVRCGLN
jgi:hypothetical protein